MSRSKSSYRWMQRHRRDPFVKRAQKDGYRSRASYKLIEIQKKDRIIRSGYRVVDLGAAPGGWSQLAARWVGPKGQLIATDILAMDPLPQVHFIQGDFRQEAVLHQLSDALQGNPLNVVLSDMAPNLSGIAAVDQPAAMYLAELALDFAQSHLAPGGHLVCKLFQGVGFDQFSQAAKQNFAQIRFRKPQASRAKSREVYLVGLGFKA